MSVMEPQDCVESDFEEPIVCSEDIDLARKWFKRGMFSNGAYKMIDHVIKRMDVSSDTQVAKQWLQDWIKKTYDQISDTKPLMMKEMSSWKRRRNSNPCPLDKDAWFPWDEAQQRANIPIYQGERKPISPLTPVNTPRTPRKSGSSSSTRSLGHQSPGTPFISRSAKQKSARNTSNESPHDDEDVQQRLIDNVCQQALALRKWSVATTGSQIDNERSIKSENFAAAFESLFTSPHVLSDNRKRKTTSSMDEDVNSYPQKKVRIMNTNLDGDPDRLVHETIDISSTYQQEGSSRMPHSQLKSEEIKQDAKMLQYAANLQKGWENIIRHHNHIHTQMMNERESFTESIRRMEHREKDMLSKEESLHKSLSKLQNEFQELRQEGEAMQMKYNVALREREKLNEAIRTLQKTVMDQKVVIGEHENHIDELQAEAEMAREKFDKVKNVFREG